MTQRRILFISTAGTTRARMAAGLLLHLGGDQFAAFAAAPDPTTPDPLAARALGEIGATLPNEPARPVADYLGQPFDAAVTLCDGGTDI